MRESAHRGVILPVATPAILLGRQSLTPCGRSWPRLFRRFFLVRLLVSSETMPPVVQVRSELRCAACLLSTPKITPRYALHAGDRPALSPGMRDTHTRSRPFSRHPGLRITQTMARLGLGIAVFDLLGRLARAANASAYRFAAVLQVFVGPYAPVGQPGLLPAQLQALWAASRSCCGIG
jgi:hypothetical protein